MDKNVSCANFDFLIIDEEFCKGEGFLSIVEFNNGDYGTMWIEYIDEDCTKANLSFLHRGDLESCERAWDKAYFHYSTTS